MNQFKNIVKLYSIFLLLLAPPSVFAIDSDREKPIQIQADSAELNESKGIAVYDGNVILEQGSLVIHSRTLTVFTQNKKVSRVLATGAPATYQQKLEEDKPEVKAQANVIEYHPKSNTLVLTEGAFLTQGENQFEGQRIEYDINQQILSAVGNTKSSDSQKPKQRVKMILPPSTN